MTFFGMNKDKTLAEKKEDAKKAEEDEHQLWECSTCGEEYESETESDDCCTEPDEEETFECPECEEEYDSKEGANDCCHKCSKCGDVYDTEEESIDCCPEEDAVFTCEDCSEEYTTKTEAVECCKKYVCTKCDEEYDEKEEAKRCCETKYSVRIYLKGTHAIDFNEDLFIHKEVADILYGLKQINTQGTKPINIKHKNSEYVVSPNSFIYAEVREVEE